MLASKSAIDHFVGQPRVNFHVFFVLSAVSSSSIVPSMRSPVPAIHFSRQSRSFESAVKPSVNVIGDHFVAPTSMNVVSFVPPSFTGMLSVSYLRPETLLKKLLTRCPCPIRPRG